MRETGIYAESEQSVQSYKCSSGIFTQQGSTVVYKEKQINLHNMKSVHTRILTLLFVFSFFFQIFSSYFLFQELYLQVYQASFILSAFVV